MANPYTLDTWDCGISGASDVRHLRGSPEAEPEMGMLQKVGECLRESGWGREALVIVGSLLATSFSLVPWEAVQHKAHAEFTLVGGKGSGLFYLRGIGQSVAKV